MDRKIAKLLHNQRLRYSLIPALCLGIALTGSGPGQTETPLVSGGADSSAAAQPRGQGEAPAPSTQTVIKPFSDPEMIILSPFTGDQKMARGIPFGDEKLTVNPEQGRPDRKPAGTTVTQVRESQK